MNVWGRKSRTLGDRASVAKKLHRRIITAHKQNWIYTSVPVVVRCLWTKTLFSTSNNIQKSSKASVGVEHLAWKGYICNSCPPILPRRLIIKKNWCLVFILAWSVLVLPKVQEWGRWICRWTSPLVNNVYFYWPIYPFVEKTDNW